MLQASRLRVTEGVPTTISGSTAGSKVRCSNQALPIYNDLVTLANKGNHWAGLIVRGIKGLASGRLHMDNVYVQSENNIAYGRGIFYVVLPGATATFESCDDGGYQLRGLKTDTNYLQKQKNFQKPGLWRVRVNSEDAEAEFQPNGAIYNEKFRSVVISDRTSDNPIDVAFGAKEDLTKLDSTIGRIVQSSGFDLHYTPGEGHIVGLKPVQHALKNSTEKDLTKSATQLANTMYKARNLEGILWFADWGGSAVLTRAMQILQNQQTSLDKHAIFLNKPTSNSSEALKLADKLNMNLAGNGGKSVGFTPREILGNHMRSEVTVKGALKSGAFALSTAGAGFGIATVSPSIGGAVGLAGAMYFVGNTIKDGLKKFSGKKYK